MNSRTYRLLVKPAVVAILGLSLLDCPAGTVLKWADAPAAVRQTVLANGGHAGQSIDLEPEKNHGQAVYEATIRDAAGRIVDLVIAADGKLVTRKQDDPVNAVTDKASRLARQQQVLAGIKFSHPRDITHPYLPLARLQQDVLVGTEGGKKIRVERTCLPNRHRVFSINGQSVDTLVFEDRVFLNGELEEVAVDYFAQDDAGSVYYFGEDVDEYERGRIKSHEGAWLLGKDTKTPGIILPAQLKIGARFKSEDVSPEIDELDEIISLTETVTVPAGTYRNCLKIKESLADGTIEYKYYAPGVGVVREVPADGDELLFSHTARTR